MKRLYPLLLSTAMVCFTQPVFSDDYSVGSEQPNNHGEGALIDKLKNLANYLGYDIQSPPNRPVTDKLLDVEQSQSALQTLLLTMLGAIPVNTITQASAQLASKDEALLNQASNQSFPTYQDPSSAISANKGLDQMNGKGQYMGDPVNQAVLNILATPPDDTYYNGCLSVIKNEDYCHSYKQSKITVMNAIFGSKDNQTTYPNPAVEFANPIYTAVMPFFSDLNTNSLISPLIYSEQSKPTSNSSSPSSANTSSSDNQAQQAENFIRYVTGAVTPIKLMDYNTYNQLYIDARTPPPENNPKAANAQSLLGNYILSLRVFAAQSSVALSNLYYILSKRTPQKANNNASEAFDEFKMATHRINQLASNANQPVSEQWITKINQSSPATVQKEMAVLLAEINYQLYLNRQLEERLLLTNSVLLVQNTRATEPSSSNTTTNQTTDNTNN